MSNSDWPKELEKRIGPDKVSVRNSVIEEHSSDKWTASHPPDMVVFAESTADVVKVLKFAHERDIAVTTRGAGVGYVGGCVPVLGGIALSTARMNRILGIHPEDGVAVVQIGRAHV